MSDLGKFLDERIYPALFERLDGAFPEFGWERKGNSWVATNWPSNFPFAVEHPRPDRLMVYANRPWWIKVHGHSGVRLLDYVNGGRKPAGPEFLVAVRQLGELAGVSVPASETDKQEIARAHRRERRRNLLEAVIALAIERLFSANGEAALKYLHSRGFTDEHIREMELGLYGSVSEIREELRHAGHDVRSANDEGLISEKMEGYIVVPWRDAVGEPVTIYGRWQEKNPPENKPKTIALPGEGTKASPLYFDRARQAGHKDIVAVEGIFDAAQLQALGDTRVVAYCAAQFTSDQLDTLLRYRVSSVYLCGDPDKAGREGTFANVKALTAAGIQTFVLEELPDSLDPDEFVIKAGIAEWRKRVERASHGFRYVGESILRKFKPEGGWTDPTREMARAEAIGFANCVPQERSAELDQYFWTDMEKCLGLRAKTGRKTQRSAAAADSAPRATKGKAELLPEGDYLLEVHRVSPHRAKSGTSGHRYHFSIADGPSKGRTVTEVFWLTREGFARYAGFLEAMGQDSYSVPVHPEKFAGKRVVAKLSHQVKGGKYEVSPGEYRKPLNEKSAGGNLEVSTPDVNRIHPQLDSDSPTASPRPVIEVSTNMARVVNEAENALLHGRVEIYQRGGHLARVVRDPRVKAKNQGWFICPPAAPLILIPTAPHVRELLSSSAEWVHWDSETEEDRPVLPPVWAVEALRDRGQWALPSLEAVVEAPCMLPDGSILEQPGHDSATGILYEPGSQAFPAIKSSPTPDDARASLTNLQEMLADFPFVERWHRSASIAALLTLVGRFAIQGATPLFAVSSTTPGTGKSLLVDAISMIATGREAARMTQVVDDEEEEAKRFLSVLLQGHSIVLIDNVEAPLGSATMANVLTARVFEARILGTNRTGRVPVLATFFATGNNLELKGDLARRVIPINLDSNRENPEERCDFKHPELLTWIRRKRGEFIVAALTILRAYHVAGRPKPSNFPAFGSFEAWSDLVRGALLWLGEPDPLEGREAVRRSADPAREAFASVLALWFQEFSDRSLSLRDVNDWLEAPDLQAVERARTFKDAMGCLDPRFDGRQLHLNRISGVFRKYSGRIFSGLKLEAEGRGNRGVRWRVVAGGTNGSVDHQKEGDGVTRVTRSSADSLAF